MKALGTAVGFAGVLIAVYLFLALGTSGVGSGASPIINSLGNASRRLIAALQGR